MADLLIKLINAIYSRKHTIHRVQCSLWFHIPTGDLEMHSQTTGDYSTLLLKPLILAFSIFTTKMFFYIFVSVIACLSLSPLSFYSSSFSFLHVLGLLLFCLPLNAPS